MMCQRLSAALHAVDDGELPCHIFARAADELFAVPHGAQAVAGQCLKILDLSDGQRFFFGTGHDGLGKRMLAPAFKSCRKAEECLFIHSFERDHIRHFRFTLCDGSRLVQCDYLCPSERFQGSRSLV
jgi:hypothetical protein